MERTVSGAVEPGFESVAHAFEANFTERGETGAAFSAVVDGRPVVDLWGGMADGEADRPWGRDTVQLVFSGTKGLTATCLLVLADRGVLRLDAPVSQYWPEFGAAGKEAIRVCDVLAHRARMPGIPEPVMLGDLLDGAALAAMLARHAPSRDPRADTYHPLTWGWLCGEIVRRVDGRSVGAFFAEEIATPLGLELWIGLPEEEEHRVTRIELAPTWVEPPPGPEDDALLASITANPPLFDQPLPWNRPDWHKAEMPASNAIGTARSFARLYGCLAAGGEVDGQRLLSAKTIEAGRRCLVDRFDPFQRRRTRFGAGFMLQTEQRLFGAPPDAFGHDGVGGSIHGAWPSRSTGFSYCTNQLRNDAPVDSRSQALLHALDRSLRDRHN